MPWQETCAMSERQAFINERLDRGTPVGELCKRFGISRKTGNKWLRRFREGGPDALADRSRARRTQAHETPANVAQAILDIKEARRHWGPVSIHGALHRTEEQVKRCSQPDFVGKILRKNGLKRGGPWPAKSTIGAILLREHKVKTRKPRAKAPPRTQPLLHAIAPNLSWSIDFKGQFLMINGRYCYPLTITDNCSRLLLACVGLHHPRGAPVMKICERVFREFGLPDSIRSDNGQPFGSTALGGLTRLSVWFVRLGIYPERIEPGCPEQNGRHERMHRTLKAATAKPPRGNLSAQQRAFNAFLPEFNEVRPHSALGLGVCPADVHTLSPRPFPEQLPEMVYPDGYLVRSVRSSGEIKLNGDLIYAAGVLAGERVGLKPMGHDRWELYFGMVYLGVVDARLGRVVRPVWV